MTYAWIDSTNHYLLVDDNGAPLISSECPCGSTATCWQRYEASCVDYYGSPVYGNSGTGKTSEAHWATPVMVDWSCGGKTLPGVAVTNAWVQDAPGFAHIWIKADIGQDVPKSECPAKCSVPTTVPQPDLPCSCQPVWTNVNHPVNAANYSYVVRKWKFLGWDVGPNGSTYVDSAVLPIWEYSSFASRYDKVTGSRYSSNKSWFFLGNYVKGSLDGPQSFCGESSAEQAAYKSFQDTGSYLVYSVRSASGASGVFVRLPNESIWAQRNGSDAWIEDGKLFVVSSMYKDPDVGTSTTSCCVSELDTAEITTSWVTYSRVHEMPFYTSFNSEQWGHISVDVTTTDEHLHPFIVREARGAQVPRDEIDIVTTQFVTGRYEGSPLWYYRTYVTTDWDIPQLNWDNWNFVMSGDGQNVSLLTAYVRAPGVFCPQYWFLYITEAWQACVTDTDPRVIPFIEPGAGMPCAPGVECAPPTYMLNVADDGRYAPPPYWTSYEPTETAWKHEVDESLDQNGEYQIVPGLRALNTNTDEHAYKVSRLSIKNYPTWYGSDVKCATVLDGSAWEIPQMDLSDAAWFRRGGCYGIPEKREWPDVFDTRAYTSCSCAFTGIGSVTPIAVIEAGRPASWYYKTIGFQQNLYQQEDGGWVLPLNYVVQLGHGCPENRWSGMLFQTGHETESCCVTSGGVSEWVETPGSTWISVYESYQGRDNRWDWSLPAGSFTWQGNVPNSAMYCSGYVTSNPVIYAMGSEGDYIIDSSANHIKRGYRSEPGVWQFEIAKSPCDPTSCNAGISAIAKYAIKYNIEVVDKDHCPTCNTLKQGDVVSVTAWYSGGYHKVVRNVVEETWQHVRVAGDVVLPNMDATGEVSSGYMDGDYADTNIIDVSYSVEWYGDAVFTWGAGNIALSGAHVTKVWAINNNRSTEYSYNLVEDTFVESGIPDPDTGIIQYYTHGGRIYKNITNSYMSADGQPVTQVTTATVYFGVAIKQDDDGVCVVDVTGIDDMYLHDDYMDEITAPGLPLPGVYNYSSEWAPAGGTYNLSVWGNVDFSRYTDDGWSDGRYGSMYWHSDIRSWGNTYSSNAYSFGDYGYKALTDMNRTWEWEYRPELLYPCQHAGVDVLDSVPWMMLSSATVNRDSCALESGYNSGSCYASWQSTINKAQGDTLFMSYAWEWNTEASRGAGVNPDLVMGN